MTRTGYVDLDWWHDNDAGEPIAHDEPLGDAMRWQPAPDCRRAIGLRCDQCPLMTCRHTRKAHP